MTASKARKTRKGAVATTLPLDQAALRDALVPYLRARCPVSWAEWLAMPEALRAGFNAAGAAIMAEEALAIAACLKSEEGAREVSRAIDGGSASDADVVARALDKASSLLRRVPA